MISILLPIVIFLVALVVATIRDFPECYKEVKEERRKEKMRKAKVHRVDASKIIWVKKNAS